MIFSPIFVGKDNALLAGPSYVLLQPHKLGVLGAHKRFLGRIAGGVRHAFPEYVFEIMRVVHKRRGAFVADILAHVQKMRMNDVDAFFINELFECPRHFAPPIFSGYEWVSSDDTPCGIREGTPFRPHEIDPDDLLAIGTQRIVMLTVARLE